MRASGVDDCVGKTKEGIESHDGNPVSVEMEGDVGMSSSRGHMSNSGNTVS